jgi:hypothetical protein
MAWITDSVRNWRTVALVLLLVALVIGPWVYDLINVPAEYPCEAPFVRLEGDYCGVPLKGTWMVFALGSQFILTITDLITGRLALAESGRQLSISLAGFLSLLPVVSTLLMIFRGDRHWLQIFHIVALCLAGGLMLWVYSAALELRTIRLWGPWLYTGVVLSELILEVMVFTLRRVPDRGV